MSINILDEIKNDFLVYAQEVNQNRSFPDVKDGLKPSQRAALYTMYRKGFTSDKPHVKSAKITGAIIGELWPHGDLSAYESIVRMSQPWINNLSEVEWHGANGSLLGGPEAASSRYTEARLSRLCEDGFFSNIKKDTVDFIPNFSEDDEWPSVLPAIFPRLFINGSQGIGYTIAQEWELGNLNEFTNKVKEYLKTKKVNCDDIYPDYPTGGIIINKKDIHTIYETGKGPVIVRAKVEVDGNIIKITELPYQVYAEPLIQKIKDLANAGQIEINDICNKSDDNGLLIEIECCDSIDVTLNKLYRLTDLQVTFNANQMALVDGIPTLLTLKDYIDVYLKHNIECIKREYEFDLNKANNRLEIVEGLLKAVTNIDDIIKVIKSSKSSEDARANLIKKFKFTEPQAKAIVDMRLGRLANLETIELNHEHAELLKTVSECTKLVNSPKLQEKEFIKRLEEFTSKYEWKRRTQLTDVDIIKEKAEVKAKAPTITEYMIALTKGNHIKRISLTDYKPQTKVSSEDDRIIYVVKASNKERVVLVSETGMMYKMQVSKIPQGKVNSTGTDLTSIFNDKMIAMFGPENEGNIFFTTNTGKVKKMIANDVCKISKSTGVLVMKLVSDDKLIDCRLLPDDMIIEATVSGKKKKLNTADFICKGRGAGGVKGFNMKPDQELILLN